MIISKPTAETTPRRGQGLGIGRGIGLGPGYQDGTGGGETRATIAAGRGLGDAEGAGNLSCCGAARGDGRGVGEGTEDGGGNVSAAGRGRGHAEGPGTWIGTGDWRYALDAGVSEDELDGCEVAENAGEST